MTSIPRVKAIAVQRQIPPKSKEATYSSAAGTGDRGLTSLQRPCSWQEGALVSLAQTSAMNVLRGFLFITAIETIHFEQASTSSLQEYIVYGCRSSGRVMDFPIFAQWELTWDCINHVSARNHALLCTIVGLALSEGLELAK